MTDLLTKTLASIVTEDHRTAAVFEKFNLDFCCRGKRSLKEACREQQVNPAEVLMSLEETLTTGNNDTDDIAGKSLQELADYIVQTHHSYVKRELPLIDGYLQKVAGKHGGRHPELIRIAELFTAIREEMDLHMQKEEKILFPRIAEAENLVLKGAPLYMSGSYINAPVAVMEQEHDHAGSMMAEIRQLSGNYDPPADACTTYRLSFAALQQFEQDLHRHVHLENNILFPGAARLFGQSPSDN